MRDEREVPFNGTTAKMGLTMGDGQCHVVFIGPRGVTLRKAFETGASARRFLSRLPLDIKLSWLEEKNFK